MIGTLDSRAFNEPAINKGVYEVNLMHNWAFRTDESMDQLLILCPENDMNEANFMHKRRLIMSVTFMRQ